MNAGLDSPWFDSLLTDLRALPVPERADQWPELQFERLAAADGWRWNIPVDCGGLGWSPAEMLQVYRRMAAASLVTTFILTQRNAACQRIETSENRLLRWRLLEELCEGRQFATVGISHLTTSRQHLNTPAVLATRLPDTGGFQLDGNVPWATGATRSQILVTGGTTGDGLQILAAVPVDRAGVTVQPPVELMGLSASQTGSVSLKSVFVSDDEILHGPVAKVMSYRSGGGAGSLGTSALALGAAEGTLNQMQDEVRRRPELQQYLAPLQAEAAELALRLERAAAGQSDAASEAESLRRAANLLVIRSAQVWLATTKGAGYVAGHPAERAVRESMFFLVWSCPQPVLEANLRELSCGRPEVF